MGQTDTHTEPRAALSALIKSRGIRATFRRLNARTNRKPTKWDAEAGHVEFTLTAGAVYHGEPITHTGQYSAGSGILSRWALENPSEALPVVGRTEYVHALKTGRRTLAYEDALAEVRKRWLPELVDVMQALLVDCVGMDGWATLRDWIDDTGMEWEHPADAVDAYEACKAAHRFCVRAFAEDFEKAQEIAQEV